jgi:hypothetical protein
MAVTVTKQPLSGSTHGRGIKVTTVGPIDGSDTTIHTAVASTTDRDEVSLYAYNSDSIERLLHLGWGGTTLPDDGLIVPIPSKAGWVLVVADLLIRNSLVVVASAETANVIALNGYVHQIRAV